MMIMGRASAYAAVMLLATTLPSKVYADDDPWDLFATAHITDCTLSGKVVASLINKNGPKDPTNTVFGYKLSGYCFMQVGTQAYNEFVSADGQWNPKERIAQESFYWGPKDKPDTTIATSIPCSTNPWLTEDTVCTHGKHISEPGHIITTDLGAPFKPPIFSAVGNFPPYPLSASMMTAADRAAIATKAKTAMANPTTTPEPPPPPGPPQGGKSAPVNCKAFLDRPRQLVCSNKLGFGVCKALQKNGAVDVCLLMGGTTEENVNGAGCKRFLGRVDERICTTSVGYALCEKARKSGDLHIHLCFLAKRPESGLLALGCVRPEAAGVWRCPSGRARAACQGAVKQGTAETCF